MRDILFYALYLAPFAILLAFRDRTSAHVFKVSCANLLMLFYLLYNHVGLVLLYRSQGGLKQLLTVNPDTVILLAAYTVLVVLVYVGTGIAFGSRTTAVRIPDLEELRRIRINWLPMVLVVGLLTPLAIWKVMAGSPLLLLLEGDAVGALAARVEEVTTDTHFLGIKPSYLNTLWAVFGFVQILALIIAMTRRKMSHVLFFIFATVVLGLQSFSGVSKGAIVGPLYIIFIAYALLYSKGVILNKALWWGMLYVVSVVAAFSAWAAGLKLVNMWYPFERLLLGNLLAQYVVVDRFDFGNLLYGATVPHWFSFGIHKQFLLDVFAWREIMRAPEGVPFYTAPSSFVAEAHANFHVLGVVLVSLVIFSALRGLDYLIKTNRSELIYTAMMIDSSLRFAKMAASGASSFIVDYYYWAVLLFAFLAYRVAVVPVPIREGGSSDPLIERRLA